MNEHPYFCVQNPLTDVGGVFLVYKLCTKPTNNENEFTVALEKSVPEHYFERLQEAEDFFIRFMVENAPLFDGYAARTDRDIQFVLKSCKSLVAKQTRRGLGNVVIAHGDTAPMHLVYQKLLGAAVYQSDLIPPYHALVIYKGNNKYDGAAVLSVDGNDTWLSMHPNAETYGVLVDLRVSKPPV